MAIEPVGNRHSSPRDHLSKAVRTLSKRRRLVLKVAVFVLAAIGISTLMVTPRYKATASLYVRLEQTPMDPLSQDTGRRTGLGAVSPLAVLNSYVETLLSRTTAEQIVRDLELDKLPPSKAPRERVKRAITGAISSVLSFITRTIAGGVSGEGEDTFRKTVDDLMSTVTAEIDQDTELILITVLYPDRRLAQAICREMADALTARATTMTRSEARAAYETVAGAVPAATKRLSQADKTLADFKRKEGIVDLTDEQRLQLQQLSNLEAQHAQAQTQLKETEARLAAVQRSLEEHSQPITLTTVLAESPEVRQIKGDLYEREQQLAALLSTHTEEHPEVIRLESQVASARERLSQAVERVATSETKGLPPEYSSLVESLVVLESDRMGLRAHEEALASLLEGFRGGLRLLPAKQRRLEELIRDQQAALNSYVQLVARADQLRLASEMSGPPVAITTIDPPRLPKGVSDIGSPPYVVIIILGPILSLIIGLTAAFVAEYFTDTLGSAEEVADSLALPVLASVPHQQGAIQTSAGEPEAET